MSIGFLASIKAGVSTLTSRLTSDRAGYLDRLDAAITTRAAASTALSSATWTAARAGYLDKIGVKSIQQGTCSVACTSASFGTGSATLGTAVDTAKAICLLQGYYPSALAGGEATVAHARVSLSSTTSVQGIVSWYGAGTNATIHVGYTVIEFNG